MTWRWFNLDWNFYGGVIVTTLKLSNMIKSGHCSQKCICKITIICWKVCLLEWKLFSSDNVINLSMSMCQILMSIINQIIKWFQSHTHVVHIFYVRNVLAYFTTLKSLCSKKSYFYFYLNLSSCCYRWIYVRVHVWICVSIFVCVY
jgi:hypothetical protein